VIHYRFRSHFIAAALCVSLAACSSGAGQQAAFTQTDFNKSFTTYFDAESTNFSSFATDPPLSGTSECSAEDAGKDSALVLCKVGEFDSIDAARAAYGTALAHIVKALPTGAKSAEQQKVSPQIPVRFVAASGERAVALVLTQEGEQKWLVGLLFKKQTS
jgi:hypothetical protein